MAMRQIVLVAALFPVIAFAANTTTVTWNATSAAATLVAQKTAVPAGVLAAAGTVGAAKLVNLVIAGLTSVVSGASVSGIVTLTMDSSTAALADPQFPRWIAKAIASITGVTESRVDVSVSAARRLSEGRRLTATVNALFQIFSPTRARDIGLAVGVGLGLPLVVGSALAIGLTRDGSTVAPTLAPTPVFIPVTTTAAPEAGSSMPVWAAVLLGLALLACIAAAVMLSQKKEKKKRAIKKAAPVKEEVRIVEEVVPMLAPPPMVQTYQPMQTFQPVMQQGPMVTYAAPAVQTVQAAPTFAYAAPAPAYTSISRGF